MDKIQSKCVEKNYIERFFSKIICDSDSMGRSEDVSVDSSDYNTDEKSEDGYSIVNSLDGVSIDSIS